MSGALLFLQLLLSAQHLLCSFICLDPRIALICFCVFHACPVLDRGGSGYNSNIMLHLYNQAVTLVPNCQRPSQCALQETSQRNSVIIALMWRKVPCVAVRSY